MPREMLKIYLWEERRKERRGNRKEGKKGIIQSTQNKNVGPLKKK